MGRREKYFLCPRCESVRTKTEIDKAISRGGYGMCCCDFDNGRVCVEYEEIKKMEYDARLKELVGKK